MLRNKLILPLSVLVFILGACGVDGDKIFSANANDDTFQVDLTVSGTGTIDVLGNDGGSGRIIEDVTQGYYGTVTIGTGGLTVDYTPNSVSDGTHMTDWFEYRIRTNNFAYSVGRVAVRFTQEASDRFEPDDFQEYARPVTLRYGIPYVEDHTSDVANPINPGGGSFIGGQTIGGDEDWFVVNVLAAPGAPALVPYLRIETVGLVPENNALVITVMDQWGFLIGGAVSGSGTHFPYTGANASMFDATLPAGRYLVRVNPETGHSGPFDVRFTMYEAAPLMAPPVGISALEK